MNRTVKNFKSMTRSDARLMGLRFFYQYFIWIVLTNQITVMLSNPYPGLRRKMMMEPN